MDHIIPDSIGRISKDLLRDKYEEYCRNVKIPIVIPSEFGKLICTLFNCKTSRLRTNGSQISKRHYLGISWKSDFHAEELMDFSDLLAALKSTIPTLRRCPKASRIQMALELANTIDKCTSTNNKINWYRLLAFPYIALHIKNQTWLQ